MSIQFFTTILLLLTTTFSNHFAHELIEHNFILNFINNQHVISNSFSDIIVWGNVTTSSSSSFIPRLVPDFLTSHQFAIQSENWFLLRRSQDDDDLVEMVNGSDHFLFFIVPSSMENFYKILDQLSALLLRSKSTCQGMFFLVWPHHQKIETKSTPQVDNNHLINYLTNDSILMEKILKLPQNGQVYAIFGTFLPPATKIGQNEVMAGFKIFEFYGILHQLSVINQIQLLGTTKFNDDNPQQLDLWTFLTRFGPRRKNFQNATLKILALPTVDYRSVMDVHVFGDGRIKFRGGAAFKIFLDFQHLLNFSYIPVTGTGWTVVDDEGKFYGLGGQIINGEADLSITINLIQVNRSRQLWFLHPVLSTEVLIFFRPPASSRNIFSLSFESSLWVAIFLTWFLLAAMLCIIFMIYQKKMANLKIWPNFRSPDDILIWVIATLCQQGWTTSPKIGSLRIVVIATLLSSLCFYSVYTAAFVATISMPEVPIKRYSDLAKFRIKAFMDASLSDYAHYFVSDKKQVEEIVERSKILFEHEKKALDKVMRTEPPELALIIPEDQFYAVARKNYHRDSDLCVVDHIRANQQDARTHSAMFMRKWAEYKEFFELTTIVLMERGFNHRYWAEYKQNSRLLCLKKGQWGHHQLGFRPCYFAFAVLVVGFILGVVSGFLEKIVFGFLT